MIISAIKYTVRNFTDYSYNKNSYTLSPYKKIQLKLERNVYFKNISVLLILLLIIQILNYIFDNYSYSNGVFLNLKNYINFPLADLDSARYFFSAIPQSLGALVAISFTVLFIYLQIIVDKYSIQVAKNIFGGWRAIIILNLFIVTILYSFYKLGNINSTLDSNLFDTEMKTVFTLSIICSFGLVLFFYHVISNLSPEKLIKDCLQNIRTILLMNLDLTKSLNAQKEFFVGELNKLENVEISGLFSLQDEVNNIEINTSKKGFVEDINVSKINECSSLLSSISSDYKLVLTKSIGSSVIPSSSNIGYVNFKNNDRYNDVQTLAKKAYKINSKDMWIIEVYKELEPLTSLIINLIANSERSAVQYSVDQMTALILEYIQIRKSLLSTLSFEEVNEFNFSRIFLDEYFSHIEQILDVCVEKEDSRTVYDILHHNRKIVSKAIDIQDFEVINEVNKFNYYAINNLDDKFLKEIINDYKLSLNDIFYNLKFNSVTLEYIKSSEIIITTQIKFLSELIKYFIDTRNDLSLKGILVNSSIHKRTSRLIGIEKYQLEIELDQSEPESEQYFEVKSKIKSIEEIEKLKLKLDNLFCDLFFSIGTYLMLQLESKNLTMEYSQPILYKLAIWFQNTSLTDWFGQYNYTSIPLDNWLINFDEEEAHFVDSSHMYRFFILINALIIKQNPKKDIIKKANWLHEFNLRSFKKETKSLKDQYMLWDLFLDQKSRQYFDCISEKLSKCSEKRTANLYAQTKEAILDKIKVSDVCNDVVEHTKKNSYARLFVNIESRSIDENVEVHNLGISQSINKIFFVSDSIDSSTQYDGSYIGKNIGELIGRAESEYITQKIYDKLDVINNRVVFEKFTLHQLDEVKDKLSERGYKATSLVFSTNLYESVASNIHISKTESKSEINTTPVSHGSLNGLDVFLDRSIPKNNAIIFDKTKIGTLHILSDVNAKITDDSGKKLQHEEIEKQPNEASIMIKLDATEKIGFEFGEKEAGFLISVKILNPLLDDFF